MAFAYATSADDLAPVRTLPGVYPENIRTDASAVSWGAIVAGGAATAALSFILLMLGTGLGLSSVSTWAHNGVSAATFGVATHYLPSYLGWRRLIERAGPALSPTTLLSAALGIGRDQQLMVT